ncbi:MAG: glucosaminidase domain-containing protein [Chryseolinea sp.]
MIQRFKYFFPIYLKQLAPYILLGVGLFLLVIARLHFTKFTYAIRTQTVRVTSPQQIVKINSNYVLPILYTHVNGLAELPSDEAKVSFISAVLPAVLVAKHEIDMLKVRLDLLKADNSWSRRDSGFYHAVQRKYKGKDIGEILSRIGTLPNSIVIAQAAVESGWGQSRFFLQANNLFGVWSFNSKEPRIAAGKARGEKTIYLKSYNNISESIINYFEILSSSPAYKALRAARSAQRDPFKLLPHLVNFSERRRAYTRQLKTVIEQNDLTVYDDYEVDPDYIFER